MSNTIPSSNMNMPIPVAGVDPGPDWALNYDSCLLILDSHTHTPGSGVPITPAGMNISTDLTFNSNNATTLRSVRFAAQVSPLALASDVGCAYVSGVDLWFNDVNGNQVRITQSGGVVGSPGSISGLSSPASATYVAGTQTFVWQSAANTPANMDGASFVFRNLVANSKSLTLNPPAAMGANYSLSLPALPATTKIMSLDNTGAMAGNVDVDGTTLQLASNTLSVITVPDNAITTAKILDANVTPAKLTAVNSQSPGSTGVFNTTSVSFTNVTNSSTNITASGARPIEIFLQPDGTNNGSFIQVTGVGTVQMRIVRDLSAVVAVWQLLGGSFESVSSFYVQDAVIGAGSHNYVLQVAATSGTPTFFINYAAIVAREL